MDDRDQTLDYAGRVDPADVRSQSFRLDLSPQRNRRELRILIVLATAVTLTVVVTVVLYRITYGTWVAP